MVICRKILITIKCSLIIGFYCRLTFKFSVLCLRMSFMKICFKINVGFHLLYYICPGFWLFCYQ